MIILSRTLMRLESPFAGTEVKSLRMGKMQRKGILCANPEWRGLYLRNEYQSI